MLLSLLLSLLLLLLLLEVLLLRLQYGLLLPTDLHLLLNHRLLQHSLALQYADRGPLSCRGRVG